MRKLIPAAISIALIITLALGGPVHSAAVYAQDTGTSETTGAGSSEEANSLADKFIFRTSEEVSSFMETYTGKKEVNFKEPRWSMNGSPLNLEGYLTPDKSAFTTVNATYQAKKDDNGIPAEEILWAFYQDLCEKTEVSFPEAEEMIPNISSLEDERYQFYNWPYGLEIIKNSGNNPTLNMYRKTALCDSISYTPDDARTFMEQNAKGKSELLRRSVSDDPEISTGAGSGNYAWSGYLDTDERLYSVTAEYSGSDPEEGKAFLTAFAEYFLTGDVLEEGKKLISENYDTIEERTTEKADAEKPYSISLRRNPSYYRLTVSINQNSIPSDAQIFPNADELAALQLDPIARKGIDKTLELPETVVFAQDDVKIIMEGSYYDTYPELCIKFRLEGAPETAMALVRLTKINGQDVDFRQAIASSDTVYLENGSEDNMALKLPDLQTQVPGFEGLYSITVSGDYCPDMSLGESRTIFKDVACGSDP